MAFVGVPGCSATDVFSVPFEAKNPELAVFDSATVLDSEGMGSSFLYNNDGFGIIVTSEIIAAGGGETPS